MLNSADDIVVAKDAKFAYIGDKVVLSVEDFRWHQGQSIGIIGQSGSGKSTFVRGIFDLGVSVSGHFARGTALTNATAVSYVSQSDELVPWKTILENLLWSAGPTRQQKNDIERARGLLDSVGLKDAENKYPDQLSGGMARRLMFCMALFKNPSVLVLDEALAAMDAITKSVLLRLLSDWISDKKHSLLFISHDLHDVARLCDEVFAVTRVGELVKLEFDGKAPEHQLEYSNSSTATKALLDQFTSLTLGGK